MTKKAQYVFEKHAQAGAAFKAVKFVAPYLKNFGSFGKNYGNFVSKGEKLLAAAGGDAAKANESLTALFKSHSTPNVIKGADGLLTTSHVPGEGLHRIGDAVSYLSDLGKGVRGSGALGGMKQFGKNLWNAEKGLWKNETYKVRMPTDKNPIFTNSSGKEMWHGKFFDRKVVGRGANGEAIIKKTIPGRALGYTMTPGGMIGTGALLGEKPSENIAGSLMWTPATRTFGEVKMLTELPGMAKGILN